MKLLKFLIVFSLFLPPLAGEEKMIYVYEKDIEGKSSKTTWAVEEKNKNLHIQGTSGSGETLIITTPPLHTQSFSHQSKSQKSEYYIHRDGSYLFAKRIENGKVHQKEFKIGNDFWLQEFDFSMRPFILSKADSLKFYIVHPTDLSLHHMIATKSHQLDRINIKGKVHELLKVKITLTGFKKMFWKAELWFDQNTGDLVKYMANEGPNTPMHVITLFSKGVES